MKLLPTPLLPFLACMVVSATVPAIQAQRVFTLPPGTIRPIRISDEIDTKTAKANDTFGGTTASNVGAAGFTLIPTGTPVIGRTIEAKPGTHFAGAAELSIELVSIRLPGPTGPQDIWVVTEPLSSKATGRGGNTAEKAVGGRGLLMGF
jgi:hypothetical protein